MRKRSLVVSVLAVAVIIGGLCAGPGGAYASPGELPSTTSPADVGLEPDLTGRVHIGQWRGMPLSDRPLYDAYKRFAFKFYQQCLAQDPGASIFVSPLSVSSCLSMVYNGAAGTTQDAMAKALELKGLSFEDLNRGTANLMASLMGGSGMESSWFEVSIANSLWARKGVVFRQDYMDRVTSAYSAKLTTLDFGDPQSVDIMNEWVKEQTRGKIEKIVDEIKSVDILVLLNTVYFKGKWLDEFDKNETKEREFTLADGTKKMHPMMRREGSFSYYKGVGFQAVSIPYGYGPLSMYVFLPDKGSSLESLHRSLTLENWDKWLSEFKMMPGELIMPRFKLEYEPDLDAALKALGMEIAFIPSAADFSGMVSGGGVWLDRTRHKTYVDVNEEGTEAAAVTMAVMAMCAFPGGHGEPFIMHVDRPFFFAIRDSRTDTILFMGSITDPKE